MPIGDTVGHLNRHASMQIEAIESLLKPYHNEHENMKHSPSNSIFIDIPKAHSKPRPSSVSKHSIELFINNFPKNDTEYANREILSAVGEIMTSDIGLNDEMSTIDKVRLVLLSHKFHLILIFLVVLDCVFVIAQLVIDIINKDLDNHSLHIIEEIAEIGSVIVLSLFIISIILHLIFVPHVILKSKLEMFDALIVIISFALEIVSILQKDSVKEIEAAVITFRFWRIIRIVNAIVITVEKRVYEKLDRLKDDIKAVLEENNNMICDLGARDNEVVKLKKELVEKDIELTDLTNRFQHFLNENQKSRLRDKSVDLDTRSKLKEKMELNEKIELELQKTRSQFEELEKKLKDKEIENEGLRVVLKLFNEKNKNE